VKRSSDTGKAVRAGLRAINSKVIALGRITGDDSRSPASLEKDNQMADAKQQYMMMKFTVLQHQQQQFERDAELVGGYAYAWANDLYPALHDGVTWHVPFRNEFEISENELMAVLSFLAEEWDKKNPLTFYELEDHFGVQGSSRSTSSFTRWKLCRIVRYLALDRIRFDENFWTTLLANGTAPSEALSLGRPLSLDEISPL
jgi:hypothetical protein